MAFRRKLMKIYYNYFFFKLLRLPDPIFFKLIYLLLNDPLLDGLNLSN